MSWPPTVTIYNDLGGQIGAYLTRFRAFRSLGRACRHRGHLRFGVYMLSSLCQVGSVLRRRPFWNFTRLGIRRLLVAMSRAVGNRILWAYDSNDIRKWTEQHGGLKSQIICLRGAALTVLLPSFRSMRAGKRP